MLESSSEQQGQNRRTWEVTGSLEFDTQICLKNTTAFSLVIFCEMPSMVTHLLMRHHQAGGEQRAGAAGGWRYVGAAA